MATLLFVMRYPLHRWDNLKNKFDGQMAAARALGFETRYIGWDGEGMWLCGGAERALIRRSHMTRMPGYEHTKLYIDLMAAVEEAVRREAPDLVYLRYMPVFGNAVRALSEAKKRGARLVVEHPTYPPENGRTTSLLRKPVFAYNARVFQKIHPMIDLYALIGNPCGDRLEGRPAMNILNGVDVEKLPLHAPRPDDGSVALLALASMSRWQGYDRLLRAMAAYRGDAAVTLHMAGGEGDGSLAEWKRMSRELGLSDRVVFHGELHGEALDRVAARCDIGVGGLGLYRKGQYCSMTLKLREYMARGLPFVYAVDDPSIPEEPRFCLKLKNDGSALSMEEIVAFARRARGDTEAPLLMRAYARERMSWEGVLRAVLERVGMECAKR